MRLKFQHRPWKRLAFSIMLSKNGVDISKRTAHTRAGWTLRRQYWALRSGGQRRPAEAPAGIDGARGWWAEAGSCTDLDFLLHHQEFFVPPVRLFLGRGRQELSQPVAKLLTRWAITFRAGNGARTSDVAKSSPVDAFHVCAIMFDSLRPRWLALSAQDTQATGYSGRI